MLFKKLNKQCAEDQRNLNW